MKISIVIPTYNEEDVIEDCLKSLSAQIKSPHEIILVDDGSTDKTLHVLSKFQISSFKFKIITQNHQGPGVARNLGAKHAIGEILVFVDSDMTFAPDFLEQLVTPIENKETKGTFTREEYVSNWNVVWARFWNMNQGIYTKRRIPEDYPETAPVFRAILKSEFIRAGGFTPRVGWTDDWTLSEKLGYKSTQTRAICYHKNPASLSEVFFHAKWVGKNVFISGSTQRAIKSLLKYFPLCSIALGLFKSIRVFDLRFLVFKIVYDFGIITGIWQSIMTGERNK